MNSGRLAWFFFLVVSLSSFTTLPAQIPAKKAMLKKGAVPPAAAPVSVRFPTVRATVPPPPTSALAPELTDELVLKSAGLRTDGPALLDFFRKRTRSNPDHGRLEALVRQVGEPMSAAREEAVGELVAFGTAALPVLRQAAKDVDDGDRVANVRRCLQALEGGSATSLPAAAARLVARRKPAGAVEVLVAYLPQAPDEAVIEEVKTTLLALACRAGPTEPALVQALGDPLSLRRAVAAEVLCQTRTGRLPPELPALLKDPKPLVRLRVALALAERKEAEAVITLIALLTDLPLEAARQAEDYLLALAEAQAPQVALGTDAAARQKCRDAWAAWWAKADGTGLLAELRKRSPADDYRDKAQAAIKRLGDDAFDVREQAVVDLLAMGRLAAPFLQKVADDPDPEVRQRAQRCLKQLGDATPPVSAVTVRLLAYRKPAGAAEALLQFLPFGEEEAVAAETREALAALAVRDGRPEPAVVRALADKLPQRRAATAEALGTADPGEVRRLVRPLLKDADATVQLRAGLALAAAGDREAIPVLIDLLGTLPPEPALPAEEFLTALAGPRAPVAPRDAAAADRNKHRDAWAAWWKDNAAKVELAVTPRPGSQRQIGYTLLVLQDAGTVQEIDRAGKVRWQLTGLYQPFDAQALPGNRVLVAEFKISRVAEYDLKGNVLWQKRIGAPVGCQRLPNGNTFIVTRNQLVEVDRGGKEVSTYNRPNYDITAAHKLRDGQIVFVTTSMQAVRLDAGGKEVKSIPVGQIQMPGSVQVLPNGNVLVPLLFNNQVAEYDAAGRVVWQVSVQQPASAVRLHNGHTLIATQWPARVLELDRSGKTVWEHQTNNQRVVKATRR